MKLVIFTPRKKRSKVIDIDPDDENLFVGISFHIRKQDDYIYVRKEGRRIPLGRYIISQHQVLSDDQEVDHINRNPLDNRKCNLRICTPAENALNKRKRRGDYTSQYKGVSMEKNGTWSVCLMREGSRYRARNFDTERDAAIAYDILAREIHGEFASPNFTFVPDEDLKRVLSHMNRPKTAKRKLDTASSSYFGVCRHNNGYKVTLRKKYVGYFTSEREAAIAYNNAALAKFGPNASLNNIPE